LAARNPAPGANISVEIEIMATGASIKTHTAPAGKTRYVRSITLATKTPDVRSITLATKTPAQCGIL
jgi:hypothetical protein